MSPAIISNIITINAPVNAYILPKKRKYKNVPGTASDTRPSST